MAWNKCWRFVSRQFQQEGVEIIRHVTTQQHNNDNFDHLVRALHPTTATPAGRAYLSCINAKGCAVLSQHVLLKVPISLSKKALVSSAIVYAHVVAAPIGIGLYLLSRTSVTCILGWMYV